MMWVCVYCVENFESICSENVRNTEDSQKGGICILWLFWICQ